MIILALKNRVRIGSSLEIELSEGLKKLSEDTRIPISKLLDESIRDLLIKHKVEDIEV